MENKYTLEEWTQNDSTVEFILSCSAFSVAGSFNKQTKTIGKWAASPTKFKTKEIKTEAEKYLATIQFV